MHVRCICFIKICGFIYLPIAEEVIPNILPDDITNHCLLELMSQMGRFCVTMKLVRVLKMS